MYISMNWIKDYVELPSDISASELGVTFTLSTCEVEGVQTVNTHLKKVMVAEITDIEQHPDADTLQIVTCETGTGTQRVVCGAPNAEVGKKVPHAGVGVTLPGGFTIAPEKIRGVESAGMLCSGKELDLAEDHAGLMILAQEAVVGMSLAEHLGIDPDIVFDIDNKSITHRPDLWGHYGMAREFAAIFSKSLKDVFSNNWRQGLFSLYTSEKDSPVKVQVDPDSSCLGFKGISMDKITVKPSPQWMQNRLIACGLRPINNIVDISNFVMLETGMPNHIYDRDTILGGEIHVQRLAKDIVFETLDGQERQMIAGDTMVFDKKRASGIGGIMGGCDSSINDATTKIFLESANWIDAEVRRTSVRLGLRTDASQRYEKSLDTCLLEQNILRLVELIKKSCPDAVVVGVMQEDGVREATELKIAVSVTKICNVLGTDVTLGEIVNILESLDFKVEISGEMLDVTVPSFRATKDIEIEDDIIEEIGRIIGYDNIRAISPVNLTAATRLSKAKLMQRQIQDFMVLHGQALEIMTYPLIGEKLLEQVDWPVKNEKLTLVNALSQELSRMRPSMVPTLLEKAAHNQKNFPSFRFFELGRSYEELGDKDFSQDRYQLGVVFFDRDTSAFMELVNIMEALLRFLNIQGEFKAGDEMITDPLVHADWTGLHPSEFVNIKIFGRYCGFINTLHPLLARRLKVKGNLSLAILDITDFMDSDIKDKTTYKPVARYPGADFDCTVVADSNVPVQKILSSLTSLDIQLLENIEVVDVYRMSEEKKSVTLRSRFLDRERTLSSEVIKELEDKVIKTLDASGYPLKS